MNVKPWSGGDADRWDRFVRRQADGTFFHLTGWKTVIERTYGFAADYFYAEEDGEVAGVLPLFHVRRPFAGSALISVPFGVYGGVLAASEAAQQALLARARDRAAQLGAGYVEFKSIRRQFEDLPTRADLYVTFRQELDPDPEVNLERIPRKTRRMVRVSLKNGLEAEVTRAGLSDFYEIYAASVHRLGTPVFPRFLFTSLLQTFPKDCFFLFVRHGGRRVGGVLTFAFRDTLLPYYGGALREFNHLAVNNFMYWQLMEHGRQTGYRWFDFGRSKRNAASGSYDFKRHWGMQEVGLEYQYYLRPGVPLPDVNSANPRYQFLVSAWKKLPLPLTKILGPRLVRYFP